MAIIETIEVKQGANGVYWRVKAGGWYSVFDKTLGPQLAPGKELTAIGQIVASEQVNSKGGPFKNVVPFEVTENYDPQDNPVPARAPASKPAPAPAPAAVSAPARPQQPYEDQEAVKRRSIERQSCLKASADIMAHAAQFETVGKCAEDVEALANRFLAWVQGGQK